MIKKAYIYILGSGLSNLLMNNHVFAEMATNGTQRNLRVWRPAFILILLRSQIAVTQIYPLD